MKRKIYSKLLEWKAGNGESALLIDGARRVGKSYIAEEFAKNEYKSYILLDFNIVDDEVKNLFNTYLSDLDSFFMYLSNYYGVKLHTRESLIIFDEVQEFPKARTAIKYLVADQRYDYIETGSLISINENTSDIVIPSEEDHVKMFPMDFEEFLWALGDETSMDFVRTKFEKVQPMGALMHRKLMDLFRLYMIIGGMPQAIVKWIETKDFDEVDKTKRRIISLYRKDILKHNTKLAQKIERIFDTIPSQLSTHEKRFKVTSLGKNSRMRDLADCFTWLQDSMTVNECFNVMDPNVGLSLTEDRSGIKCYMGDTGLLISMAFDDHGKTESEIYKKLLYDKLEINKGMLVENIVAQMLVAHNHKLNFYSKSSHDKDERMEVDFIISKQSITARHNIIPIEVKSSTRYTLSSLLKFIDKFKTRVFKPYVLHSKDLEEKDGITYLPLYMAPLL